MLRPFKVINAEDSLHQHQDVTNKTLCLMKAIPKDGQSKNSHPAQGI
jgi:hypothetical protein